MDIERKLYEKAESAALNAAWAISESETWFLGTLEGEPPKKRAKAWAKQRVAWMQFARDNPNAPAEALWIKGGALGLHDGKIKFAELPVTVQIAFATFHKVLNEVSDQLQLAEKAAEAAALRAKMDEERAARAARPPTEDDLEGTPLEPFPDPLAPSEFAPRLTETGFQHRFGAQAQGDQAALQPASPEFLRYQQEQAEKEEAEKAAAAKAAEEAAAKAAAGGERA